MCALERHTPRDATAEQTIRLLAGVRSRVTGLADLCIDLGRDAAAADETEYVMCHSDLHAGNLHIGTDGDLYVVDWDELLLAPPERDLMFIGGGLLATGLDPSEECRMFYSSYSLHEPRPDLLTYFRIRRILVDIVEFCRLLFGDGGADEDRVDSLGFLKSNFDDGGTIDVALESWR